MNRYVLVLCTLPLAACSSAQRTAAAPSSGPSGETAAITTPARPPRAPWQPRTGGPTMEQLLNVHRAAGPSAASSAGPVAFLSDAPGLSQAFTLRPGSAPVNEASWQRVTRIDDRVHYARFTPNGRYLFLGRDHGGDENVQILRAAPTGENLVELTTRPTVKNMFGAISRDSRWIAYASNERSPADFDIYVRGVERGEPRRLFDAERHFEAHDFSPDARRLVVSNEHSSFNNDLYLVEVATGTRTLLTQHEGDVRYSFPRFTRDGRKLFVVSDQGREFMNLAVMDLPSGRMSFVLDDAHDVDDLALAPTGTVLALAVNVDGWTEVRLYDVSNPLRPRALAPVQLPRAVVSSMSFAPDGRTLVLGAGRSSLPDEIFRVEVASGRVERLTESDHAGVEEQALVEPVLERVTSFDGLEVPVFLYRPRDLPEGARAPVVVMVHGGPESQAQPRFNPVIQFLVGHGYMVAEPNVRGSTGYGKRYAHLDDVERREDSVRDLAEINRWLRARADVDPDRIAVMGGSYGGYMTLAAITLYPEMWAAACDIVGIANFRTFLERTAPYRRHLREAEYGSLERDGEFLDRVSPLHRVDQIRTPLMVIHGANDPRVPVHEAEQIVQALRERNQRVEYLRFENEGHGIARRENKIRAYGDLVRFFDSVMAE